MVGFMKKTTRDIVIAAVASRLAVDSHNIKDRTNIITDLSADSLDIAELLMDFEDAFDIKYKEGDEEKLKTIGEIVIFIDKRIARRDKEKTKPIKKPRVRTSDEITLANFNELLEAVKDVEWNKHTDKCQECGNQEYEGHSKNCRLGRAIAELT